MTIPGSVFAPTELMNEQETMEIFCECSSKFAFSIRKLAKIWNRFELTYFAETAECMKGAGVRLNNMKSMSKLETLMACSLKSNPKEFLN